MSKFHPPELSEDIIIVTQGVESSEDYKTANSLDISSTNDHAHCNVAQRAEQQLAEWIEDHPCPQRMPEIASDTNTHIIIVNTLISRVKVLTLAGL